VIEEGNNQRGSTYNWYNIRAAQHYVKKYNDDEDKRLPVRYSKMTARHKGMLTEDRFKLLVESLMIIQLLYSLILGITFGRRLLN
jgi:hypothetical protein